MRDTVITLLFDIGMSPHYAGYRYLVYAICDVLQNNIIFSMMKLYKKIADEFDCTPYAAERCIRTAITSCWEYGNQDKLLEIFGRFQKGRPGNAHFIATLAVYLQLNSKIPF